ncbi:hypothetical protein ECPA4_3478, partial [Escherichia coli PA4]
MICATCCTCGFSS